MKNVTSRKEFLTKSIIFTSGIVLAPKLLFPQNQEPPKAIDPKIVNEFVKVAHSDLDRVKEMIKEYPLLLNSSWDWGGGDFETALGAAGHMGLKDSSTVGTMSITCPALCLRSPRALMPAGQ